MVMNRFLFSFTMYFITGFLLNPSLALADNQQTNLQAPLFDNLGSFHHAVSTKIPLAQRFFDQGFVLFYGFEWGESIRSFREAIRLDPHCGMCYWGLALSLGNKINAPMTGHEYSDAKTAIQKALLLAAYETPIEQDYIKALSLRFAHVPKSSRQAGAFSCHKSSDIDDVSSHKEMAAYSRAMKEIVEKYPNDIDVKALYGAALYWGMSGSNPTYNNPNVIAATKILVAAIAEDKLHIGANHYYIHITEPYTHPNDALRSANLFRTRVPGSEHLVHMPTHIYFLTGRYHQGSDSNLQAIATFKKYNKTCYAQGFKPEINYLYFHNYDFLRSTAAMEGRKMLALSAAKKIIQPPFPAWLTKDSTLQWFIPIPYYVQARFGMWNDLVKEPMPNTTYKYALGMWHYAHGIALAKIGDIKAAEEESLKLNQIIKRGISDSSLGKSGHSLLKIANEMLMAILADVHGDEKSMLTHLKSADNIQHNMGYHEPPDWYFPIKEIIADAYLKWGHPKQALELYEKDLKQYPKNGWALFGLAKSLKQLGRTQEADRAYNEFKEAWKYSDIPAPISIFVLKRQ